MVAAISQSFGETRDVVAGIPDLPARIVLSGYKLSRYGDSVAEKSGMGRIWIGGRVARF